MSENDVKEVKKVKKAITFSSRRPEAKAQGHRHSGARADDHAHGEHLQMWLSRSLEVAGEAEARVEWRCSGQDSGSQVLDFKPRRRPGGRKERETKDQSPKVDGTG